MFLKELFRKTTETNVLILPGRREVKEDKQTNKLHQDTMPSSILS